MEALQRQWYIYALVDPRTDEVRYVGWAFDVERRLRDHIKATRYESTYKANWLKQLLAANLRPIINILETNSGSWADAERRWIDYFKNNGARLTNLTNGGDGMPGYKWTDTQREKLRNRVFTDEHRARISRSKTGQSVSAAAREKISAARKGQPMNVQHRERLIAIHTGKPLSEEHKQKIREQHTGRILPREGIEKMRASLTGRKNGPPSEETRRKLSASKIGQPQLCGICKSPEHNRRTCPQRSTTND